MATESSESTVNIQNVLTLTSLVISPTILELLLQNNYELYVFERIKELDTFAFILNLNIDSFDFELKFVSSNNLDDDEVIVNPSVISALRSGTVLIASMRIPVESRFYSKLYSLSTENALERDITISANASGLVYKQYKSNFTNSISPTFPRDYGDQELLLTFSVETSNQNSTGFQQSVDTPELDYSLLSSLGNVQQEAFTVTSTTGSASELLLDQTENVSDVGGLSGGGRDREITSTGISSTIATEAGLGVGVTSTTVTTSGY